MAVRRRFADQFYAVLTRYFLISEPQAGGAPRSTSETKACKRCVSLILVVVRVGRAQSVSECLAFLEVGLLNHLKLHLLVLFFLRVVVILVIEVVVVLL